MVNPALIEMLGVKETGVTTNYKSKKVRDRHYVGPHPLLYTQDADTNYKDEESLRSGSLDTEITAQSQWITVTLLTSTTSEGKLQKSISTSVMNNERVNDRRNIGMHPRVNTRNADTNYKDKESLKSGLDTEMTDFYSSSSFSSRSTGDV
jgi:hypothetical protein